MIYNNLAKKVFDKRYRLPANVRRQKISAIIHISEESNTLDWRNRRSQGDRESCLSYLTLISCYMFDMLE